MTAPRALLLLALGAAGLASVGSSGATFTSTSQSGVNVFQAAEDWVAPTVTLTDPGTPLRGTVTLNAAAADTGSGIATVELAARRQGATTWTTICTRTSAVASCELDTRTLPDGTYDFRATATDRAGLTAVSTVAARIVDNASFAVTLADPGAALRGQVALSASVSGTTTVTAVRIQIRQVDSSTWRDVCVDSTAPYGCSLDTTAYATDLYDLRATATNSAGTVVTSAVVADVQLDNLAPAAALADPGTMRGVVTLTATASDADAGVRDVVFQRSPAGRGEWTEICTDAAEPFTCRFDTAAGQTPDGSYDLRVVVTDAAGNVATALRTARVIDNTVFTVSLDDPGAFLRGAVTLTATANAGTVGVRSVQIEQRATGAATWTAVCADATAPYSCALDTTALADGTYELRAVMTPASGAAVTSAVVASRIDNSPLRGADAQADNRTGGTAGRLEAGDVLRLTWSEAVRASTLATGWSGAGAQAVTVRLRDGALAGGSGSADVLDFPNNPALGVIALRGNYVRTSRTITFPSTMTLSGGALAITLGTPSMGGLRTWSTPTAMVWTPSAQAQDLAGNASSAAPVTETGTADKDF